MIFLIKFNIFLQLYKNRKNLVKLKFISLKKFLSKFLVVEFMLTSVLKLRNKSEFQQKNKNTIIFLLIRLCIFI